VPSNGGPTLHHVQLVTITYSSYAYQSDVESFGDWVVASSWYTTAGADYGVQAGTHVQKVRLPGTLTAPTAIADADIQTFLDSKINDGTLPAPGALVNGVVLTEPLYAIYYPETTTITLPDGAGGQIQSCQGFGGYHAEFNPTQHAGAVSYAVLPVCPSQDPNSTDLQQLTLAASHELIEAATDPFPYNNPGYTLTDSNVPWTFIPGEVGDLCYTTAYVDPSAGWTVQPVWSNSAATRSASTGESPCVPWIPNQPFVDVTTDITYTALIQAGGSVTYQLSAFSNQAVAGWYSGMFQAGGNLTASWSMTANGQTVTQSSSNPYIQVNNGDTGTITVTAPAGAQANDYALFYLISSNSSTSSFTFWPIVVYVQ
jgi:hypothetical protein